MVFNCFRLPERFFIMLMIGLILFVFLLILFWRVVIWFVGTIGAAKGLEEEYRKYTRSFGIFIAVATVLFFIGDEIYTNMQFKQLCKKEAGLKVYKKVGNVDGFLFLPKRPILRPILYHYDLTKDNFNVFSQFNYIEQNSHSDKYHIKWYETVDKIDGYKISDFIFEDGYSSENDTYRYLKRTVSNFNNFNEFIRVDVYQFNKESNNFQMIKENTIHKSKYAYIDGGNYGKYGFYYSKSAIIDIDDYSVIAEIKSFINYGGKLTHIWSWLISGYRFPISKGSCGSGFLYPEFIHKILQPTVQ